MEPPVRRDLALRKALGHKPPSGWFAWLAILWLVLTASVQLSYVEGESMARTLEPGDHLVLDRMSARLAELERGDIIVFNSLTSSQMRYVKRVVALPGECVEIKDGHLYVDDELVFEELVDAADRSSFSRFRVPPNHAFVLGDNRLCSEDSRTWGAIPIAQIEGVARFRFWPMERFGFVDKPIYPGT